MPSRIESQNIGAEISLHASIGHSSSGFGYSVTRSSIIKLLRAIEIRDNDNVGVQFLMTRDFKDRCQVATLVQAFYFQFPNSEIKVEDLQVTSQIILQYQPAISFLAKTPSRSTCTFGLSRVGRTPPGAVIGIIGLPKSGKTTFIEAILRLRERRFINNLSMESSAGLQKYSFPYYAAPDLNSNSPLQAKSFSILSARGYIFNSKLEHDQQLLKKIIAGLSEGTDFSKNQLPSDSDAAPHNGLTHVILTVNARDIQKGQIKWTESYEGSQHVADMYTLLVKYLAASRHMGNDLKARANIFVLVTHADMLGNDQITKTKERTKIKDILRKSIPENKIVFG